VLCLVYNNLAEDMSGHFWKLLFNEFVIFIAKFGGENKGDLRAME